MAPRRGLGRPGAGPCSRAWSSPAGWHADVPHSTRQHLNRLLYRSRQRGYLELDLLLGTWTSDNIKKLDKKMLAALVQVLDEENPDLWKWLTGQLELPESMSSNPVFSALRSQVAVRLDTLADPATRATPGAPWVRGWDDRDKKAIADGHPPAGNQ
eukprot:SM000270S10363  [mRNA]  locus=s270:25752:27010:+ [translate_table: standard]